ncbi:MAG: hypothetical protein HQM02_05055 [Magnetococcales bacterium]|nr:hypothetical protein [Magnetococcales bacterium]
MLFLSLVMGCSKAEEEKGAAAQKPVAATQTPAPVQPSAPVPAAAHPPVPAAAHPPVPAAPSAQPERIPLSGKVVDSKQAGAYTYVQVEAEGVRYWLATNQFEPEMGVIVHWERHSVMKNFYSKALNQTFPMVLFVGAILPGPASSSALSAPAPMAATPVPASTPAATPVPASTPAAAPSNRGKVHAVLQSGGYLYLQINNDAGPWLAVPSSPVKEGDSVVWGQGTLMQNFTSKTLNRTFAEILFLGGVQVE